MDDNDTQALEHQESIVVASPVDTKAIEDDVEAITIETNEATYRFEDLVGVLERGPATMDGLQFGSLQVETDEHHRTIDSGGESDGEN